MKERHFFTEKEINFILKNKDSMTYSAIACILKLKPNQVLNFIQNHKLTYFHSRPKGNGFLTETEQRILPLLIYQNSTIAKKIHVQPSTVKTHINNIMMKFNAHTKAECLIKALKEKKINLEVF